MSAAMQIAVVDGRERRYHISGDSSAARTLVLLHAFPLGTGMFAPQERAFPGWRLVIPALPGFDGSAPAAASTIDAYAGDLLRLLDHLNIERALFGGVSLGGYLAFGVLRRQPERVSGLILADTRSAPDAPDARPGREKMRARALADGPPAIADDMLPKLLGETTRRDRPDVVRQVREMIERQRGEGIAAAVDVLMSRPDSTPVLAGIEVPTLVIVGKEDVLTPPAEMEKMAGAIKGARFVEIEAAGHLANLEAPDDFNREVAGWLSSHLAT
jgi:3-oxoadipate enol-lactonase